MNMDEIRSFLLGGKTHLLRYEGLVTAILTALIVLALLIVSGGEGKKERSVLWSGAGTAVILLCPGVCMLLEKLTEGSLGDGKSYMAVPAAAIISYGGIRVLEYCKCNRKRILAMIAIFVFILFGISVPLQFSFENFAVVKNEWKVRPEALEAIGWIGIEPAIVPEELEIQILRTGTQTGVLWNHRVVEYNEKDVAGITLTARNNQCTYIVLRKSAVREFDAAWAATDYYMQAYGYQKQNENARYFLYGPIPPEEPAV